MNLPWDFLYYHGTVTLNMKEEKFWKCTLRKLMILMDVHGVLNIPDYKKEEKQEVAYIDQVLF